MVPELPHGSPERFDALLSVVQAVTGHPLSYDDRLTHDTALRKVASLPQSVWMVTARRAVGKRGYLNPDLWLKLAERTAARERVSDADGEDLLALMLGTRPPAQARGAKSSGGSRAQAAPTGNSATPHYRGLCGACGSLMGVADVCGCNKAENAGRSNN